MSNFIEEMFTLLNKDDIIIKHKKGGSNMKEFFAWLFSEHNSSLKIGLFDGWHFLYLFIVFGGTLALSLIGQKRPERQVLLSKIMAYLTVGLYVIDFFIMPLMVVLSVAGVCLVIYGAYFLIKAICKKRVADK